MPRNRSVRTLVAAVLFVLALFIAMGYLVEGRNLVDWWLPLALLIVGIAALVLDRTRAEEEVEDSTALAGPKVYAVREYTFADPPAVALAGPEQAGEVNVLEPLDEEESPPIAAPETLTPPAAPVDAAPEPDVVPAAPETLTPPEAEEAPVEEPKDYAERAMDDVATAGDFAPPTSAEGVLNPPTESDVQQRTPVQTQDPARPEMPLEPHEVAKPEQTQAERLEETGELIQPADTAENEFQDGEHVAFNQPTQMPPPTTVTTGEGAGEGTEPMAPEEKEVLDATAAPPQPSDLQGVDPTQPDVAEAVLDDREDEATTEGLAPSERITTEAASGSGPDDLTIILGIGARMQRALQSAGYDSFTKLAAASDDELRAAIEAAGMRLAPTLSTWREQASFLARGDRTGFEALTNALHGHTTGATAPDDDQKKTDFTDPGRS